MRIRLAVPNDLNRDETEAALNAALESVTVANEGHIRRGKAPTFAEMLKRGVRWKPEPPGDEHFDLARTVARRGWGDCDDLAPAHAASLRATGIDPEAFAFVRPSGPNRWHALVQRSNGKIQDPSRAAGMGNVSGHEDYTTPIWSQMFPERLSIAAYPLRNAWGGRVDVPNAVSPIPFSWSTLARGGNPAGAVVGAIRGATLLCGDDMDDVTALRLGGLHDLLNGCPPSVVGEAIEAHTGDVGFFGALAPAAMSLAAPVISKVLPGILPGGAPAAPGGGGGGGGPFPNVSPHTPGSTVAIPGGPIIVRF